MRTGPRVFCIRPLTLWGPPWEADLAVTPYTEPQATVCGVFESQNYGVRQDANLQMCYMCIILMLKQISLLPEACGYICGCPARLRKLRRTGLRLN